MYINLKHIHKRVWNVSISKIISFIDMEGSLVVYTQ